MEGGHLLVKAISAFCLANIDEFIVLLLFFTKAIAAHHSLHQRYSHQQQRYPHSSHPPQPIPPHLPQPFRHSLISPPHQPDLDDPEEDVDVDQLTVFQIIAGQIIGFSIIIFITLMASIFGLFLPYNYLSLIGLIPFSLGMYELYRVILFWKKKCFRKSSSSSSSTGGTGNANQSMSSPYWHHQRLLNYPPKSSGSHNSSPSDRQRLTNNQDFEVQYESFTRRPLPLNLTNYYPKNHDYSSYQNPPQQVTIPQITVIDMSSMVDEGLHKHPQSIREDEVLVSYPSDSTITLGVSTKRPEMMTSFLSEHSDEEIPNEVDEHSATSSDDEEEVKSTFLTRWFGENCQACLHKNIFYVSMVLLSDGSEELAIFIPFLTSIIQTSSYNDDTFSTTTFQKLCILLLIILIWYVLILCQCYLAYVLIVYHYESYGKWISRYSKNFIPFFLIGLGIVILQESILRKWFI